MNGIECLKTELLKRGFTKQQADSKVVLGVLEILSESNGQYTKMDKILDDVNDLEIRKSRLEAEAMEYEKKRNAIRDNMDSIIKEVNDRAGRLYHETLEYIEKFFSALEQSETPGGRDALKAAQMFVNTVDVDTKYDNTAFIIGLASILSQGNTAPIDELRKINKKIPEIKLKANYGTIYGFSRTSKDEYTITDNDPDRYI